MVVGERVNGATVGVVCVRRGASVVMGAVDVTGSVVGSLVVLRGAWVVGANVEVMAVVDGCEVDVVGCRVVGAPVVLTGTAVVSGTIVVTPGASSPHNLMHPSHALTACH